MQLPEVICLENYEAATFEDNLAKEGLRSELKFDIPCCHPVVLPHNMAHEMLDAGHDWWQAHMRLIDQAGGITAWMDSQAPTITNKDGTKEKLNNADINTQLEKKLADDSGWSTSFLAYDCMLVTTPEGPALNIIEAQSLACYAGWMEIMSRARSDDQRTKYSQFIGKAPSEALGLMSDYFDGPISVLDMNHAASSSVTHADKIVAAKTLGGEQAEPITPLQIVKNQGRWFAVNNSQKTPITNVFSRLMQEDLDEMSKLADVKQLETLKEFFNDPQINWLHHPTWQYIVNKSTIPLIERSNLQGKFRGHMIPTYAENEAIVEPGRYIVKPTGGNSGHGQKSIYIKEGDNYVVPPAFIAQKRFVPAPIPLSGLEKYPSGVRNALLEIRVMYPPQPKNQPHNATLMTRLAPAYHLSAEGKYRTTQTNIGKIVGAMAAWGFNDRISQAKLPFGIGPALISSKLD